MRRTSSGIVTDIRVSLESARSETKRRRSKSMFAPEDIAIMDFPLIPYLFTYFTIPEGDERDMMMMMMVIAMVLNMHAYIHTVYRILTYIVYIHIHFVYVYIVNTKRCIHTYIRTYIFIYIPAMPSAPAGSRTHRVSLNPSLIAAQISSVFTVII